LNNSGAAEETSLHSAIAEKYLDVAALLIREGANVNAQNKRSSRTPLHFLAAFIDDDGLLEPMIQHGAEINTRDKNGETPLGIAIRFKHAHLAEALKRYGGI